MDRNLEEIPPVADPNQFITLESGKADLSRQELRGQIMELERTMLACPPEAQLKVETEHTFTDGVYMRTVLMKAGSIIVGKIHKLEHIAIISQGSAAVYSEEFGTSHITAPALFVSPPGAKRVLFIEQDMIWTTVHKNPSNTRDLKVLESELIAPDYEDLGGQT